MNYSAITSVIVVAVMKVGQSYHGRALATIFGIPSGQMRTILDVAVAAGDIESRTSNSVRVFSLPVGATPAMSAKPLTISREMRAAIERCSELRIHKSRALP